MQLNNLLLITLASANVVQFPDDMTCPTAGCANVNSRLKNENCPATPFALWYEVGVRAAKSILWAKSNLDANTDAHRFAWKEAFGTPTSQTTSRIRNHLTNMANWSKGSRLMNLYVNCNTSRLKGGYAGYENDPSKNLKYMYVSLGFITDAQYLKQSYYHWDVNSTPEPVYAFVHELAHAITGWTDTVDGVIRYYGSDHTEYYKFRDSMVGKNKIDQVTDAYSVYVMTLMKKTGYYFRNEQL
jgi:hypothetical protein